MPLMTLSFVILRIQKVQVFSVSENFLQEFERYFSHSTSRVHMSRTQQPSGITFEDIDLAIRLVSFPIRLTLVVRLQCVQFFNSFLTKGSVVLLKSKYLSQFCRPVFYQLWYEATTESNILISNFCRRHEALQSQQMHQILTTSQSLYAPFLLQRALQVH